MSCWVEGAAGSPYDVDNLPYGVFSTAERDEPRVGVRIGDFVLDAAPVAAAEMLEIAHAFEAPTLNPIMAAGRPTWTSLRTWLTRLLTDENERDLVEPNLIPVDRITLHQPFDVADYVDFYCSLQHATNVGRIFRPDGEALLPNWRHLPVGYHGRAGTVVVSGTPVIRPHGQRKPARLGRARLRAEPAPRHRGRGRVRRRRTSGIGKAGRRRRPRSCVRSRPPQRLVGPRHPGLGVRAARPVPRQVVRDLDLRLGHAVRRLRRRPGRPAPAGAGPAGLPERRRQGRPRDRHRGAAQRRGGQPPAVRVDVLVPRPDARAHDRQRRLPAHRRPVRLRHRQRRRARSARLVPRAVSWGGKEPFTAGGRERSFLEDGDEVVLRATAPGALGGRIALGEVAGRIEPAADRARAFSGSSAPRCTVGPSSPGGRRGPGTWHEPHSDRRRRRGRGARPDRLRADQGAGGRRLGRRPLQGGDDKATASRR